MRYIGDLHGEFDKYLDIIKGCDRSIQVGDFGIGFVENPIDSYNPDKHQAIRGNHDDPNRCKFERNMIPDGTFDLVSSTFFCGGAMTVDKPRRNHGIDWWPDEELTIREFYAIIPRFVNSKPRIMVSHDCPEFLARQVMSEYDSYKASIASVTRQAFDAMWFEHKPEYWIFGHWHESVRVEIEGTTFICLNILEHIDLE